MVIAGCMEIVVADPNPDIGEREVRVEVIAEVTPGVGEVREPGSGVTLCPAEGPYVNVLEVWELDEKSNAKSQLDFEKLSEQAKNAIDERVLEHFRDGYE